MTRIKKRSLAAGASVAMLATALSMGAAQADDHIGDVDPVGNWKLTGLQIGDGAIVPCPTPTTDFSERWFCEENTMLRTPAATQASRRSMVPDTLLRQ